MRTRALWQTAKAEWAEERQPAASADDEHSNASEDEVLDFLLCLGAHCMRDEDIFGMLSREGEGSPAHDFLPEEKHIWNCTVGAYPSQVSLRRLRRLNHPRIFACGITNFLAARHALRRATASTTCSRLPRSSRS